MNEVVEREVVMSEVIMPEVVTPKIVTQKTNQEPTSKFNQNLTEAELIAWVNAWLVPGVGAKTFDRLLRVFGSMQAAWHAKATDWRHRKLPEKLWAAWNTNPQIRQRQVEKIMKWLAEPSQHLVHRLHPNYPSQLRSLQGMPPLIFIKGQLSALEDPQLAIVGSRNPTREGLTNARDMASYLTQQGIAVVSGLARGIDTEAHQGAVDKSGTTIAVVAHGLDQIYPKSNQRLAGQILEQGAIVSEFPLGVSPRPQHFPRRNGLISGLSLGVCVIEAALKSGSLITAKWAVEQGREVFAMPGSINNPLSKGCHHLIRQGAKLVESAEHIFEELLPQLRAYIDTSVIPKPEVNSVPTSSSKIISAPSEPIVKSEPTAKKTPETGPLVMPKNLSNDEEKIYALLGAEPVSVDEMIVKLNIPASTLMGLLLGLEMQAYIKMQSGGYSRAN